jgi:hypothetical protein
MGLNFKCSIIFQIFKCLINQKIYIFIINNQFILFVELDDDNNIDKEDGNLWTLNKSLRRLFKKIRIWTALKNLNYVYVILVYW